MARITKAQRQENKQNYDEAIYRLFLDIGWEKLTYERVSKELDVKKSTLQSYYPSKSDFFAIWEGRHEPMYLEILDFSSKSAFITSWYELLKNEFLAKLVRYALNSAVDGTELIDNRLRATVSKLASNLDDSLSEDEVQELMHIVIGISVMHFSDQKVANKI